MTELEKSFKPKKIQQTYKDKTFKGTDEEYKNALEASSMLYVGEISNSVSEERLWELFELCGPVKRIIMGVNKNTKIPCGFAFVEYYSKENANDALKYLNGIKLSDKYLKVDMDYGFVNGRQFGRGALGGQFREDNRKRRQNY